MEKENNLDMDKVLQNVNEMTNKIIAYCNATSNNEIDFITLCTTAASKFVLSAIDYEGIKNDSDEATFTVEDLDAVLACIKATLMLESYQ